MGGGTLLTILTIKVSGLKNDNFDNHDFNVNIINQFNLIITKCCFSYYSYLTKTLTQMFTVKPQIYIQLFKI